MCGITGFLDPDGGDEAALRSQADAMAIALAHRGPDDHGTWVDGGAGIAFGFRRLAIVDLTPTGAQPMVSADQRWVMSYNGELYNRREIAAELSAAGLRLRGTSDTEVVLEAVARWGVVDAFRRTNGMFGVALWDRENRVLHLVRDRLGEKPLYAGRLGRTFVFASELDCLRRHAAWTGELDDEAVGAYLRHGYVPAPLSILKGIGKVEPGTVLSVRADLSCEVSRFWDLRQAALDGLASPLEAHEAAAAVGDLLSDSVARRMVADVPVGAFLSGGIDSSLLVALMQRATQQQVRTYTIGFDESAWDEAPYARVVADHLGTVHTERYLRSRDVIDRVPGIVEHFDEPFADASAVPTTLVAELAREEVTVSLSGDGADELFGGYNRYLLARSPMWRAAARLPIGARRAVAGALQRLPLARLDRASATAWGALLPLSRPGSKLRRSAVALRAEDPADAYFELQAVWPRPEEVLVGERAAPRWTWPTIPAMPDELDDLLLIDQLSYLPDDLLVKVDRASMSCSLESRAPFLDHRLVELSWQVPHAAKIDGTQGKVVLRDLLREHVPNAIVDRPKTGFGIPIGPWLRGDLRPWAEDLMAADDGILDQGVVRSTWERHLAGEELTDRVWSILCLRSWRSASR